MGFRVLILFLLLSPWAHSGESRVYLQAEPIEQVTEMNTLGRRAMKAGLIGIDYSWGAFNTLVYFAATGEPVSTAAVGAYNLVSSVPYVNAGVRAQQQFLARLERKGEIRAVAENPGAKQVRVLSTGYFEQTGIYSAKLNTQSFVFLEAEEPPAKGNWIPIDDLDNTKVRLTLTAPGSWEAHPVEVSLRQLFDGFSLDLETQKEWRGAVTQWNKGRPFMERHITGKGGDALFIHADLIQGEKVTPLGNLTSAKGVEKLLGFGKFNWVKNRVRMLAGKEPAPMSLTTQNTRVVYPGECSRWYRRLLGTEVRRKPIKEGSVSADGVLRTTKE